MWSGDGSSLAMVVRCGLMLRWSQCCSWVTVWRNWVVGRGFDLDFGSLTVVGCVPKSPTIRLLVGLAGGGGLCSWVTDTNQVSSFAPRRGLCSWVTHVSWSSLEDPWFGPIDFDFDFFFYYWLDVDVEGMVGGCWYWFGLIAVDFFLVRRWMWMWMWMGWVCWVDVKGFFFFSYCCLWLQWIWLVAGGGDCGWMWWPAVVRTIRLKKRERQRERGRIKNNKEIIFKWLLKK